MHIEQLEKLFLYINVVMKTRILGSLVATFANFANAIAILMAGGMYKTADVCINKQREIRSKVQ